METKKRRLSESTFLSAAAAEIPNASSASEKTRELAMMNITIVILEEVKTLRKKITDLENDFQQTNARKRKQGKISELRHRSPLHISRQRSFCKPNYKHKNHLSIKIIPQKRHRHHHHPLPIRKRKINVFFSENQ